MNIFKKLFAPASPAKVEIENQNPNTVETMEAPRPNIEQFLFTEDRHPSILFPSGESKAVQPKSRKSILEDLKSKDYFSMGKRDGLEDHCFETMERNVNLIACDFREAYAKAVQELDAKLLELKVNLDPKFEQEMPFEYREVLIQKEYLEEQKRDLMKQADLTAMGDGYSEKSIELYKAGFKKAYKLWSDENLMFNPFSTL